MIKLTKEEAEKLVQALYEEVDGGYCRNCTAQAVEAIRSTFKGNSIVLNAALKKVWGL